MKSNRLGIFKSNSNIIGNKCAQVSKVECFPKPNLEDASHQSKNVQVSMDFTQESRLVSKSSSKDIKILKFLCN